MNAYNKQSYGLRLTPVLTYNPNYRRIIVRITPPTRGSTARHYNPTYNPKLQIPLICRHNLHLTPPPSDPRPDLATH